MYRKDETGKRYNRLLVLSYSPENKKWNCACDCGKITQVDGAKLRNKSTQSCGCLGKENLLLRATHNKSRRREYRLWASMLQRCKNPSSTAYPDYGGRGIDVDPSWENFENFYADMGECPKGKTLERLDNSKGYYKNNCSWENRSRQNFNRRRNSNNLSGRTGVRRVSSGKWQARIVKDHVETHLGTFDTFEEACKVRSDAERKIFGFSKE